MVVLTRALGNAGVEATLIRDFAAVQHELTAPLCHRLDEQAVRFKRGLDVVLGWFCHQMRSTVFLAIQVGSRQLLHMLVLFEFRVR